MCSRWPTSELSPTCVTAAWCGPTTTMLAREEGAATQQSFASGERCESVAEPRSEQRTTAYTGLLAHATDAQPRVTPIST
jgi:hypothetical protein